MDVRMAFFRGIFPVALTMACLGSGLLVSACDGKGPGSSKENAMTPAVSKTRPPLDRAAPAKAETASFALG